MLEEHRDEQDFNVFSDTGLATVRAAAAQCLSVFTQLWIELENASREIREINSEVPAVRSIFLSKREKVKRYFLRSDINRHLWSLRDSRATLMLMLHIAALTHMKKQVEE